MSEMLKPGWTRVAFGDVVRQVRDRVDPENTDLERYVAGEHMGTDDLKIRRWGVVGDGYLGPAFHMRFKPGHVLYGSRRTYLRKVAVADFEGITANTTFVMESKDPMTLLPELLPFIMQTESFHNHSVKQSKGSVNPYINFSDLTWYEFALPPLEEQRRIAEVLGAAQVNAEACRSVTERILSVRRAMQSDLLFRDRRTFADYGNLSEIAKIDPSEPPLPENAPFVPMDCVTEWEREITRFEERGNRTGVRAAAGDVLLARITPCLENGKIAQVPDQVERCGGSTEFIVLRARKDTDKSYLYWLVSSDRIRRIAIAMMSGTTGRQRVAGSDLAGVRVPLIGLLEQRRLGSLIDSIECKRRALLKRVDTTLDLRRRLLNSLLEGSL